MSKRIAELYDQAIVLEGNGDYVSGELDPVKFAELIVENCAQAAEEYWNDAGLQRTFSPSEYIYTILGVEE